MGNIIDAEKYVRLAIKDNANDKRSKKLFDEIEKYSIKISKNQTKENSIYDFSKTRHY